MTGSKAFGTWLSTVPVLAALLAMGGLQAAGEFDYLESSSWIRITGHSDPVGDLVVPETIHGKPVEIIDYQAFRDCTELTGIQLPASLRTISHAAFMGCLALETVTIPDGVTTIGNSAFYVCPSLRDIELPAALGSLGTNVFLGCASLESMTIPAGITAVPWGTFLGCSGLRRVGLPAGLVQVDMNAFEGCSSLEGIELPAGVHTIGTRAFKSCTGLRRVDLPESLTSLGSWAFNGCTSLASVTLPDGLAVIPDGAFNGCEGLASISFPATVTSVGSNALRYCDTLERVVFHGDAPVLGPLVFADASEGFGVWFFDGAEGFTTPVWEGYPAASMGARTPQVLWLTLHGQSHDTPLDQDLNGDGVALLMAYALGLDPRDNLAGSMPQAVTTGGVLSISFPATAEGVRYRVESACDGFDWTTDGVGLSEVEGVRTASVPMDAPSCFLRLVVESE